MVGCCNLGTTLHVLHDAWSVRMVVLAWSVRIVLLLITILTRSDSVHVYDEHAAGFVVVCLVFTVSRWASFPGFHTQHNISATIMLRIRR